MPNYNRTFVIGRAVADVQTRTMPGGGLVAEFDVATNDVWTDSAGTHHDVVTYYPCEAFNRTAELLGRVKKAETVFVSGRMRMDRWASKANGEIHTMLKLVVDQFQFLTRREPEPRILHEVARALSVDGPARDRDDEEAPF